MVSNRPGANSLVANTPVENSLVASNKLGVSTMEYNLARMLVENSTPVENKLVANSKLVESSLEASKMVESRLLRKLARMKEDCTTGCSWARNSVENNTPGANTRVGCKLEGCSSVRSSVESSTPVGYKLGANSLACSWARNSEENNRPGVNNSEVNSTPEGYNLARKLVVNNTPEDCTKGVSTKEGCMKVHKIDN